MLKGSREGNESGNSACSISCSPCTLSRISLTLSGFSRLFVHPPLWYMALKAQEGLRGVPQQYSALEVQ